ncbi:MAG TPA: Rid family detoxifying hydrolase [Anaerolineales bacterium]|nr:Rid family detoxifying hydrolase [Anaerolineales bacterium]
MTSKKIESIIPVGGSKPVAPYSPGVRYGDLVFSSGQVGIDPATGKLAEGGVEAQARQCLENLKKVLEAAGSDMDHALKCTIFMADMGDYAAINEIYATYFTSDPPARSAVQVAALPIGALVEIEAVAVVKEE